MSPSRVEAHLARVAEHLKGSDVMRCVTRDGLASADSFDLETELDDLMVIFF